MYGIKNPAVPVVGCGLKSCSPATNAKVYRFAPRWGAWIETALLLSDSADGSGCSSSEERGLKQGAGDGIPILIIVAPPYGGVWIETDVSIRRGVQQQSCSPQRERGLK